MTSKSDRNPRPRTWAELRRRVLEDDYFDLAELGHRTRRARQLKHMIWLLPVILVGLAPIVVTGGGSWPILVAILLIAFGTIQAYWIGLRWERRWEELISQKSTGGGEADHAP